MSGGRIQNASKALQELLSILPPTNCIFNVIGFGSNFVTLFPESVPTSKGNIATALKHATALQADLGGINSGQLTSP